MVKSETTQPTNRDLLKEIREVKAMQASQHQDIQTLKDWRRDLTIAKTAVDEYKSQERVDRQNRQKREVWKQAGIVLGLIATALYVYLQTKGIHP